MKAEIILNIIFAFCPVMYGSWGKWHPLPARVREGYAEVSIPPGNKPILINKGGRKEKLLSF